MRIKKKYQGVVIPVVTPLTDTHALDRQAVEKIWSYFRAHHAMPFILGTTGEAASLPATVKNDYIRLAALLKKADDTLYAGISSNALQESVEMAKRCFEEGVDVVVATLPTYYALTEDQMKLYFEQLADAIPGPLMMYNIPTTTHMSLPLQVIDELSRHPNIVGIKDSERSDERLDASLALWAGRGDFSHFLGWSFRSAQSLLKGGDGLVPSTGNFSAGLYNDLQKAALEGKEEEAMQLQALSDLLGNIYQSGRQLNQSLAALKTIMKEKGLCETYMMPPLTPLAAAAQKAVQQELSTLSGRAQEYLKNK
jgi:4-hydroxy-tetrahydrodipicolinate synthase